MVEGDSKRFGCIGNIDLLIFAHQQRERAAKKQSNHARYHEWLLSKQTPQNVLCFFSTVSAEPNVNATVISRRLLFWHMCVERFFVDKNEKIMRALEPKPSVCIVYEFLVFTFVIIERGWCDSSTETHTSARSLRHLSSSSFDTWSIEIFLRYFDDFWWTSKCSCRCRMRFNFRPRCVSFARGFFVSQHVEIGNYSHSHKKLIRVLSHMSSLEIARI